MKSQRRWWLLFGAGSLIVMIALSVITATVLRLEASQSAARAEARHMQSMRLALWRMDSWLGPRLTREASRPYVEYQPFFAQPRAYTKVLHQIEPGEVLTPSPLLTFESEFFPLHFEVRNGIVTSPQVPAGNWRDLAEACCIDFARVESKAPLVEQVQQLIQPRVFEACVSEAENKLAAIINPPPEAIPFPDMVAQAQQVDSDEAQYKAGLSTWSKADLQKRAQSNVAAQQSSFPAQRMEIPPQVQTDAEQAAQTVVNDSVAIEVGAMVPVWLDDNRDSQVDSNPGEKMLLFARRIHANGETFYQGILSDWPALQDALLEQVTDLIPAANLTPSPNIDEELVASGRLLASIPVSLESAERITSGGVGGVTPARTTLAITWLAVLAAISAAGLSLRASIAFGEKRSRFASAVTHELRTPLTTFRMYSEMLAEGMVGDESKRKQYLETLKDESARLSTLVENVLSYARVEEGRQRTSRKRIEIDELLTRLTPQLVKRAESAGMTLAVENRTNGEATTITDVDAVGQILFNLVDNACKYAPPHKGAASEPIELSVESSNGQLQITVRDHGPGISRAHESNIFKAFERGQLEPGDTVPGVGLGLSLSRSLARDLGGDLTLDLPTHLPRQEESGARFRLTLPVSTQD